MAHDLPLIVPLGGNCFPRWCATLLGFKKRKCEGEPTFPLDAGIFPLAMVRWMAETDFEGLTDPRNLAVRTMRNGLKVLSDRRFPLSSFNHEMPPATERDFVADDFDLFVTRYASRVENLRSAMRRSSRVVLFLTVSNLCGPEEAAFGYADVEAILASFRTRYPGVAFRILVVVERFQTQVPNSWSGDIRVFNFQMPGPYTRYMLPYVSAIAAGNVLGSVVHSFPGEPPPPPSLPGPVSLWRLLRSVMEVHTSALLLDALYPAAERSGTPPDRLSV